MGAAIVCANRFEDHDIRAFIQEAAGDPGCDFCGRRGSPTVEIDVLGEFMRDRLKQFYSLAIDELFPDDDFTSRWSTAELLFEEEAIEIRSRSLDALQTALVNAIGSEREWCEFDPARLPENENLVADWKQFCDLIKHERRFFSSSRHKR